MKKILSILIIVLVLMFSCVTTAYASEVNNAEEIYYVESNVKSGSSEESAWIPDVTSIILTIIVAGGTGAGLVISHNKANKQISATNYVAENGYKVNARNEQYVKTYTTVQRNFYGSNQKK